MLGSEEPTTLQPILFWPAKKTRRELNRWKELNMSHYCVATLDVAVVLSEPF